jgi:2,3-bisphosphoglycerate-independent phosphoglycerate mutase
MSQMSPKAPLALVVLDGWGLREDRFANAIALARTPTYLELIDRFPHSALVASGEAVGLPAGQMGNSEVGHMNLGAGRIVYQDLTRIDRSIRDGDFFDNPVLSSALDRCKNDAHAVHFVGLLSDGGVHSHERHLHALVEMAAKRRIARVFVQVLTDGRDTSPAGGIGYIGELQRVMEHAGTGRVASVGGRYYAMDRDKRWERTRRGFEAVMGRGAKTSADPIASVRASYEAAVTDEFIEPTTIVDAAGSPIGPVREGDSVIFFNFRADRMRQLTRAVAFADFDGFDRGTHPAVAATTMTEYEASFGLPVAFTPAQFSGNLAEELAAHGLTNLRLAETEKYAHVTYFFNCGEERPYKGEDRILVPSQKVATYDLKPEMSAGGITDQFVATVEGGRHDVIVCNFANADMVGHTGSLDAAVLAVQTLDGCLARIVTAMRAAGGTVIVTADHGNAEQMWDFATNGPHTAHTSNPVPVILVGPDAPVPLREGGSLRDVAPTMLGLLGIEPPREMTGRDLRKI